MIDPASPDRVHAHLYVDAQEINTYTIAIPTLSQDLPVWLDCHVRMYEAMGGVAAQTIPDNLRSAVTRPERYEAEINPSYRELATHYGTCVMPARIRKPRDKGKVE